MARADMLLLNPLSAYHDGDISKNADNIRFLYGELGGVIEEFRSGLFVAHHKTKPSRDQDKKETAYHELMYDALGGSVLTNFFRAVINVSPIPNSDIYKFTVAKRFEQSGWPAKTQLFKWHPDPAKSTWIPASSDEGKDAQVKARGKTLEDLYKLLPVSGSIPKQMLEIEARNAGFTRDHAAAMIAQALDDSTPGHLSIYQWGIYNPNGMARAAYSRFPQPANETHAAVRDAIKAEKAKLAAQVRAERKSSKNSTTPAN
jgi:hypothetical protein